MDYWLDHLWAGVVFVAARTGLDLGGFGQAYFVSGILMLTTLILGLAVIGYCSLSQRTNTLGHNTLNCFLLRPAITVSVRVRIRW